MKRIKILTAVAFVLAIGSAFVTKEDKKFTRVFYYKLPADPTCYNSTQQCSNGSNLCTFTVGTQTATQYYTDNSIACESQLSNKQ